MKRLFWTLLIVAAFASLASADVELKLTDGTNSVTITSSGVVTIVGSASTLSVGANPTTGVITWTGTVGNYSLSTSTGQGSNTQPAATLDLLSGATSGTGGSGPLTFEWSETNVAPSFPGWQMHIGGTLLAGTGSTTSYSAYESNSNTFFATTNLINTLGPFGVGAFSGTTSGAVAGVTTPYSLTQVIQLNGNGFTSYSANAALTPMPEPVAAILFGTVIVFSVSRLRRRRSF